METTINTDVLVIGGGGAAARAALEAALAGANVILMTKGSFGAIGTRGAGATAGGVSELGVFATPGWTRRLSEGEKPYGKHHAPVEQAFINVIQLGLGMADPELARILVENAVEMRMTLLDWGATFGEYGIRSHGVPIMAALVSQIKRTNISTIDRTMAVSLLVHDGECVGAIGINENNGNPIVIRAGATVISTGGGGNLFMLNLNPPCVTGDGYAIGYEAGAELMNLEFKQVFLGTVYPTKNMLDHDAYPVCAKLINATGEEFLQNYLPSEATVVECMAQRGQRNPFSTRDNLSRYFDIAIVRELEAGRGTKHHGVYLDRSDSRIPPIPLQRNEFWLYRGIDIRKSPLEVGVCHHCSLGGFRIDENAETTLPHLYAAGEVAAGPHGADRMGGHMLLASQVFGTRAGRHGAAYAKGRRLPEIDSKMLRTAEEKLEALRSKKGDQQPSNVKRMLQESTYYNLLVIRNKERLGKLVSDVRKIREELIPRLMVTNPNDLIDALELENLLLLADIEANICLRRTESRGPHYREDFPHQDDENWLKSITVKKGVDGTPELGTLALDPTWRSKGDEGVKQWG